MCNRCAELDKKIAQYTRLSDTVGILTTVNRFREIIWQIRAEKAALHAEENG